MAPGAGEGGTVLVRYFAGAAHAAGTEEEKWDSPGTVGALLEQLAVTHGDDLARVLAASSFLLDAVAARREDPLPAGSVLDVLPPFAGG
ncbi:MAG: MoaD/ThiS family protein [Janthinobacterium lividum]